MKKKIAVLASTVIIGLACLTGCNYQMIDLNYSFKNAYVKIGDEWVDLELKSWMDYEDGEQLQLTLKDGTVMVVFSGDCILYNGTLPEVK